ncbi:MAG: hypothetical protein QME25_00085 [Bacteroidota bacterium]|nr:hypothetical protein [Bacteroidota bacterium]
MNIFSLFFLILFLFSPLIADEENEYVDVSLSIKPNEIKAGGKGQIFVFFKPQKGIYINLDPPIEFEIADDGAALGKMEIPKSKKNEYLDTNKPLKQHFTIKKGLPAGTYTLKGKLIYFYCSDAEGWCSRFTQPFQFNLKILK